MKGEQLSADKASVAEWKENKMTSIFSEFLHLKIFTMLMKQQFTTR